MSARPIYTNVPGAPFQPGDLVVVFELADETADASLIGKAGRAVSLDYACGCGQVYPESPMILVDFDGKCEEFWPEELRRWVKRVYARHTKHVFYQRGGVFKADVYTQTQFGYVSAGKETYADETKMQARIDELENL
jgi:hypothetical protein